MPVITKNFVLFLLFCFANAFATDTIKIQNNNTFKYIEPYVQSFDKSLSFTKQLPFDSIKKHIDTFAIPKNQISTYTIGDTVWIKFEVQNNTPYSLLFGSDIFTPYFEIYYEVNGKYEKQISGMKVDINKQELKHANMLVSLPYSKNSTYYVKFITNVLKIQFFVVTYPIVFNLQLTNNYFQGSLIGILVLATCFCLFFYSRMKVTSYLYFSLFLISFLIYVLVDFDIILKYLWWIEFTYNGYLATYNIPYSLTTIFLILFLKEYLKENDINNVPNWVFKIGIVLKIMLEILGYTACAICKEAIVDTLIILFYVLIISLLYFKNSKKIRFSFVLGFVTIFTGYFIHSYDSINTFFILKYSFFSSYNYIIALGISIFSLNIAEQLKIFKDNLYDAQNNLILQLKENAALNDKINTELERLVDERTKQLDAFVYRASHDIKGPLRSILGITNIGLDEAKEPAVNLLFQHIKKTTYRLDNTLNDLLHVIRLNNTPVSKELIDFKEIMNKIKSNFEHIKEYEFIEINISIEEPITLEAEYANIYSLVHNLYENAIKYHNPRADNKYLNVNIYQDEKSVIIVFSDNGLGIPENQKDKIFQMFYKVQHDSTGTGLGLYIVKLAVDKLKATIELKSEVNKGSTFTITIPN